MANYNNIKATIDANIKTNNNQEITGSVLQSVLNQIVNVLGIGYQFAGIATPSSYPGNPDAKVFYIAATAGTYANFGGIVVNDGEFCVLCWNGSWIKITTGVATAEQVTALGHKVDGLALGQFYGFFPADTDLPAGGEPGYAYVGASVRILMPTRRVNCNSLTDPPNTEWGTRFFGGMRPLRNKSEIAILSTKSDTISTLERMK